MKTMTKTEALKYVTNHNDDDVLDDAELEAAFAAIYGRPADAQDRREGLWSHICAAVG